MATIACIGIIGKHDNPLHISILPPYASTPGAYLEFSFILNASLDVFDLRSRDRNRVDQDLGLLQVVNEKLSIWGWETGTGVRFAVVIDAGSGVRGGKGGVKEVGEGDVRGAFRALQTAYIGLLRNPFYTPDEHTPIAVADGKDAGREITSRKFIAEVRRIGEMWRPGMAVV